MSENLTPPPAPPISDASDAPPQSGAPVLDISEPRIPSASLPELSAGLPAEAHAMLELIGRGLAPDADDAMRAAARDLWARFAHTFTTAAPVTPAAPGIPIAPTMPVAAVMPTMPLPSSPITMAARALRQLPPEQLLDLALQRLRAALPAGAAVPTSKGIQFQLVPVTPPLGAPGTR